MMCVCIMFIYTAYFIQQIQRYFRSWFASLPQKGGSSIETCSSTLENYIPFYNNNSSITVNLTDKIGKAGF
jgi:hypothetical protein